MKTFKYRIYPNKHTIEKLTWTLDRCCEVYNACLQERRDTWTNITNHANFYAKDGTEAQYIKDLKKEHAISLYDQQNQLSPMKQERAEYLELSAAHILNDVCNRVDKAMKGFFERVKKGKKGKKAGYPRWKRHTRYDSFCYPDLSGWKLKGKTLTLTRIGDIKVKLHRPVEGIIKTCTIKREGVHWYVTFACEVETEKLPVSYEDVGIDLGVSTLATLSTGEAIEHPRYLRKAEKKLQKHQQSLSCKKRGSKRRKKAVQMVAQAHRKVRHQRKDYLHKASHKLIKQYQIIVFEELEAANLTKRPKPKQDEETGQYLPNNASAKAGLNKSILDAGWAGLVQYCTYKAANAGRTLLTVNPRYTSQMCSGCGAVVKKELSDRWHSCTCGTELGRDHNAAINILKLGQKYLREGHAHDSSS